MISLNLSASPSGTGPSYSYAFQPISQGDAAVVTVSVPNAPAGASWSIHAGGQLVGTVVGPNGLGDIYLAGGTAVTITGTSPSAPGDALMVGIEGSVSAVPVTTPTPSAGVVNVGAEVTVNGTVDVGTISGTVDANITNASIPVSGSVDANVTNATLQIAGTVDIAADQVVQVENTSGGSVTVAGTVDINSVAGTVTIDANGSDVTVDAVGQGTLLATISTGSGTVVVPQGTNTLVITAAGSIASQPTVSFVQGGGTVYVPCSPVLNSDNNTNTWVAQCPVPATYTIANLPTGNVYVYGNSGIERVEAAIVEPTAANQYGIALRNTAFGLWNYITTSPATSFDYAPSVGTTYVTFVGDAAITGITMDTGACTYHLLAVNSSTPRYVYGMAVVPNESYVVSLASSTGYAIYEYAGTTHIDPAPLQTVTVPNPAAGAQWSYTLVYPAKLRHVGAVFTTSSTAANRYPSIGTGLGNGNNFDALPNGSPLTASSAVNLSWQAGSPAVPFNSPGANAWIATIPDYGALPAGTVISSGVSGMQSTDQWSAINLQLEPV